MLEESFVQSKRLCRQLNIETDLAIVGGGMSGICAAITAARAGIKVALLQDRPVLGGNASSEVRLWVLGATSHMGNNNRWSREGGVIDEILVENLYKNKEGNPVIFDTILLDKVIREKNITLFLNTVVYDIEKSGSDRITHAYAFNSQNQTNYAVHASLFCDASGDGLLGYLAGAAYRIGAENGMKYGEKFTADVDQYGELLGHSIYFYSKKADSPVTFTAPSYALKDITRIPRFRNINAGEHGCKFWWLEYGGRKDTIHDTEEIKWELWSVVYGVWDYIKNSGKFSNVENLTLEWVGVIPGKRESRRFEGLYTLTQQDIVEQKHHYDAVAYGGWAIDLHPSDGVYSKENGCTQYHSKGIYEIPYRCFIGNNIENLFFAGRLISASHIAHGSTRVMATSALGGQVVGMAAALCIKNGILPAHLLESGYLQSLQQMLNLSGQCIPRVPIRQDSNLLQTATLVATSELSLHQIPFDGGWYQLDFSIAQLLPVQPLVRYNIEIEVDVARPTSLNVELRYSSKPDNYTPDGTADTLVFDLHPGRQFLKISFNAGIPAEQYAFVTFMQNEAIKIRTSTKRYTGILSVLNKFNYAVNNHGKQEPLAGTGIDAFEFWCPERRPAGQNIAMTIEPAIALFSARNILNGFIRPTVRPNAWVADLDDVHPEFIITWTELQCVKKIHICFDTDFDHPMESVQMGHPESRIPFCVQTFRLLDEDRRILFEERDNYQTRRIIEFAVPVKIKKLIVQMEKTEANIPCSLFGIFAEGEIGS